MFNSAILSARLPLNSFVKNAAPATAACPRSCTAGVKPRLGRLGIRTCSAPAACKPATVLPIFATASAMFTSAPGTSLSRSLSPASRTSFPPPHTTYKASLGNVPSPPIKSCDCCSSVGLALGVTPVRLPVRAPPNANPVPPGIKDGTRLMLRSCARSSTQTGPFENRPPPNG